MRGFQESQLGLYMVCALVTLPPSPPHAVDHPGHVLGGISPGVPASPWSVESGLPLRPPGLANGRPEMRSPDIAAHGFTITDSGLRSPN